ncbi:cyclic nucleotide-binding domain-containing protein [Pararhizobium sp. YC-54]|uniref:cyclic nucleotide-gated ion channel n=1 Tax=Pararhizobium sp. YC-54 TaxID=2986920 RepID=UPI0021F7C60C|nr:cyclic nucleotide-gated ion channel [Pararhizobium sp. YC-54]MCV9996766.1 cyclic nucleotide-binding domain-containing protein [Pararhizobium sp. YC-54]
MPAMPFSKISASLNVLLAVMGLLAVAALTTPKIAGDVRFALEMLLAGIWAIYGLQLIGTLIIRQATRDRMPAIAIDVLAVAVPLAAFLFAGHRDQSLYCAIWLLKPLRESTFFRLMARVISNERRNLAGVTSVFGIILFCASLAAYLIERDIQPDRFGSMPQAMWWAVTTLSTTGYGDEIPQSFAGRVLGGLVMMCGIGIFALWAGILATGFYEEVRRQDFVRNWQLVAAVPLFQKLEPAALVEVVRSLRPRVVPAGAVICRKGDRGDQMYFIVEGSVIVQTPSPIELGSGSFFGEMALISGAPRSATVSAATEVSLLSLYSVDFQMLSSRSPEIAEIIRKTARERRGATPEG